MTKNPLFMNRDAKDVENWKQDPMSDKTGTVIIVRNREHAK